jgi:hypothetical protein
MTQPIVYVRLHCEFVGSDVRGLPMAWLASSQIASSSVGCEWLPRRGAYFPIQGTGNTIPVLPQLRPGSAVVIKLSSTGWPLHAPTTENLGRFAGSF